MTDDTIDMAALARFAILPGAAPLMRAFSEIPPGPMREAVIHLAVTTAATYTGAPAQRMPDPLAQGRRPAQLTSRTGRAPKTDDPKTEAVNLRMAGKTVTEIMETTGLSRQDVYQATYEARKAGLKVPSTRGQGAEPGSKPWYTRVDELSPQGLRMVNVAAVSRGISPQAYLDRRQVALKLAQEGASYDVILKATDETESKIVSAWLSSARAAGHKVPYVVGVSALPDEPAAPEPSPEPVQEAIARPVGRVFPDLKDMAPGGLSVMQQAAERRNLTLQAYLDTRESVVRLRLDGMNPAQIARTVGQDLQFVKEALKAAQARNVYLPPLILETTLATPSVTLKDAG